MKRNKSWHDRSSRRRTTPTATMTGASPPPRSWCAFLALTSNLMLTKRSLIGSPHRCTSNRFTPSSQDGTARCWAWTYRPAGVVTSRRLPGAWPTRGILVNKHLQLGRHVHCRAARATEVGSLCAHVVMALLAGTGRGGIGGGLVQAGGGGDVPAVQAAGDILISTQLYQAGSCIPNPYIDLQLSWNALPLIIMSVMSCFSSIGENGETQKVHH